MLRCVWCGGGETPPVHAVQGAERAGPPLLGRRACAVRAVRARRCGRARATERARAVRGSVACSARRGRPHRSVEQKPAMPGPRLSRAA